MSASPRYWNILRISLENEKEGYKYCLVPPAQEFCQEQAAKDNENLQISLLTSFQSRNYQGDSAKRARAGLCLRCYISHPILKACKKIDSLFAGNKSFSYRDLLPYVLNDDGKSLVILDDDGKTQVIIEENGKSKASIYKFFSIKVLQTFSNNSQFHMSLDNWTYLQTKQNQDIKEFLSEFGFKNLSEWALLNRVRSRQLQRLSSRSRHLIETFHAVYRRDRISTKNIGIKRCPDPSFTQQQEMLNLLQKREVTIKSNTELIHELKLVARELRQFDIWSYRETLETYDQNSESFHIRTDLPTTSINELDIEQRELLLFINEQLHLSLTNAIEKEIKSRISNLQKSKKYVPFATRFIFGLQMYYCKGMSLKDIAPKLEMSSWDQARRVLNPGEILSNVRAFTVQTVLEKTLEKAHEKGLTEIPPNPDYLKNLAEQIESFVDAEIFQEAIEEIRAGKSRYMESLYAQKLRDYLKKEEERAKK
ncbi:MAG: hypothetical protein KME64_35005 [Scytonematopsis contorta HA4267-MV1]|jgi:hypothetical protein|nr:hypothetical protein [Scytonematopsis contorta HA4267-MV1]